MGFKFSAGYITGGIIFCVASAALFNGVISLLDWLASFIPL